MKAVIHSVAGFKVCILDAAVLLEAEWDRACHEVWVTVVPPKEVSATVKGIAECSCRLSRDQCCGRVKDPFVHSIGTEENC